MGPTFNLRVQRSAVVRVVVETNAEVRSGKIGCAAGLEQRLSHGRASQQTRGSKVNMSSPPQLTGGRLAIPSGLQVGDSFIPFLGNTPAGRLRWTGLTRLRHQRWAGLLRPGVGR